MDNTVIYSIASPDIADLLAVARKVLTRMTSATWSPCLRTCAAARRTSGNGMGLGHQDPAESAGSSRPPARRPPPVINAACGSGGVRCRSATSTPAPATGVRVEISGAFGPVYDAEQYGARLLEPASPRHADALLVTGVVTRNMADPLRNTVAATPTTAGGDRVRGLRAEPGLFADAYGVVGAVGEVVPVDVEVPGCRPPPGEIVAALRSVTGK